MGRRSTVPLRHRFPVGIAEDSRGLWEQRLSTPRRVKTTILMGFRIR
ncbi:MAG: hypothetical protein U0361_14455 [Nitrospiraceae bacterium]